MSLAFIDPILALLGQNGTCFCDWVIFIEAPLNSPARVVTEDLGQTSRSLCFKYKIIRNFFYITNSNVTKFLCIISTNRFLVIYIHIYIRTFKALQNLHRKRYVDSNWYARKLTHFITLDRIVRHPWQIPLQNVFIYEDRNSLLERIS